MADDINMQAGEYVLGTLSASERQAFDRRLAGDAAAAAAVADWQARLAPLHGVLPPVAPPAALLHSIEAAMPHLAGRSKLDLLQGGLAGNGRLQTALSRWRSAAMGASALAAMLAIGLVSREMSRAEAVARPNYVAVVNRGGDQPALIVRVDLASGTVLVRPVAAETPAGKSLELWYINAGAAPKSMGVIGSDPLRQVVPVKLDSVFAVTLEPQGGSPTGDPTGPVVYSGKLLAE